MQDLKEKGNEAMKQGNYNTAITFYTKAIDGVASEKQSHVYYNNRAIAYSKLQKFDKALEDSTSAIAEKRDYVKAYSTKGAALLSLGRLEDAVATWRSGLEIDSQNASILQQIRNATNPPPSAPPAAAASVGRASSSSGGSGWKQQIVGYTRILALVSAFLYLIPLGGVSAQAWTILLISSAVSRVLLVLQECGMPQMNGEVRTSRPLYPSLTRPT
jgi:tetratricopeptide (TPR) repeat protein